MNKTHCQTGSALTVSILSSAILTLLASGLFSMTIQGAMEVYRLGRASEALLLADVGTNIMISRLKEDFSNKDDPTVYPSGNLGRGSYSAVISQPGGRIIIESTGTVKGIKRKTIVEVKWEGGEAFDYGVFSNGDLSLGGSSEVIADARSNQNMALSGNGRLQGNAEASGSITTLDTSQITGTQTSGMPPLSYPTFDFNQYYNLATEGGLVYNGNQNFNAVTLTPGNGVMYVNGNVTLSGNSTLNGVLVATGSIVVIDTFVQTQVGSYPSLMSRDSDISIGGNATLDGLVYTALGSVTITGIGLMTGQIVSFGMTSFSGTSDFSVSGESQTPPGLTGESSPIKRLTYHE